MLPVESLCTKFVVTHLDNRTSYWQEEEENYTNLTGQSTHAAYTFRSEMQDSVKTISTFGAWPPVGLASPSSDVVLVGSTLLPSLGLFSVSLWVAPSSSHHAVASSWKCLLFDISRLKLLLPFVCSPAAAFPLYNDLPTSNSLLLSRKDPAFVIYKYLLATKKTPNFPLKN